MSNHRTFTKTIRGNDYRFVWERHLESAKLRAFVERVSDISPGFGRGFGQCLRIERHNNGSYCAKPDFMPRLQIMLPLVSDVTDQSFIKQSELKVLDSTGYHTERTVLVSYKNKQYVAKGHADSGDAEEDRIIMEWELMSRLTHQNIAKPFRFVRKGDRITAYLIKFQPNGNAQEYIIAQQKQQNRRVDLLYKWPKQLASAMRYLHSSGASWENTKLKNCLVDENEDLLLIDFDGLHSRDSTPPEIERGRINFASELRWRSLDADKAFTYRLGIMVRKLWETTPANQDPQSRVDFTAASHVVHRAYRNFNTACVHRHSHSRPSLGEVEVVFEPEMVEYMLAKDLGEKKDNDNAKGKDLIQVSDPVI